MSVAVAVSGGADSLLALLLLKEQGRNPFALHGFFLPAHKRDPEVPQKLKSLCRKLDIVLQTCDLSAEFQTRIINPFLHSYCSGLTPNPCALCNRRIKFGLLLQRALELGASHLATGHYARMRADELGNLRIFRGLDPDKEQSYFLALIDKQVLPRICLPLGSWHKKDVYPAIHDLGLEIPLQRESQEVCFIPENDYRSFLEASGTELPKPGPILDSAGRVLGRHQGLHGYTIGQRRGLGIAFAHPLYVLYKDLQTNSLIVGSRAELQVWTCSVKALNLQSDPSLWPDEILVQTLYRQQARPASLSFQDQDSIQVRFQEPIAPPAPGQVAAFYLPSGQLLGGGIINQK